MEIIVLYKNVQRYLEAVINYTDVFILIMFFYFKHLLRVNFNYVLLMKTKFTEEITVYKVKFK